MKYLILTLLLVLISKIQSDEEKHIQNSQTRDITNCIVEPLTTGYLPVSEIHQLYYATYGNPEGTPVVVLHGGPGVGFDDVYLSFFDLRHWHVIMFDQRGAMRSKPFACMEENTTQDLINDIEKLKKHIGILKWMVFGNSWGSALSVAYGETYPESCKGFILQGTFLGREEDISFFKDMGKVSSSAFADFLCHIPLEERSDIPKACYQRLMDPDPKIHLDMATALMRYQMMNTSLPPNPEVVQSVLSDTHFILSFTRAFVHYAFHQCFLNPNQVLKNVHKVTHLPCIIVHGALDDVCNVEQGVILHECWPASELKIIENAGHSCKETKIVNALKDATNTFILK